MTINEDKLNELLGQVVVEMGLQPTAPYYYWGQIGIV